MSIKPTSPSPRRSENEQGTSCEVTFRRSRYHHLRKVIYLQSSLLRYTLIFLPSEDLDDFGFRYLTFWAFASAYEMANQYFLCESVHQRR
jgi:hypothetical protein